jgi:hypothetical protein
MSDLFHRALKWMDHNRYLCEPRAVSPFNGQPATQSQLQAQAQAYQAHLQSQLQSAELTYQQTLTQLEAEAAAHQAHAQAALDDIHRRKQALLHVVESLAQVASATAGPSYASLIGSAVGIAGVLLGAGAAADSRRKDQVILSMQKTPGHAGGVGAVM